MLKIPKLITGGEVARTDYVEETSFELQRELIYLDVEIQGRTYAFIFDTGASISVLAEHITADLDYDVVASSKVNAVENSSADRLQFVRLPRMTIAGVDFDDTAAVIADLSHFERILGCTKIDGLIGNSLMRKAGWQIDYGTSTLKISDDVANFEMSEEVHAITMDSRKRGNVYLDVMIDSVSSRFTFDTGSSGSLKADTVLFNQLKEKNEDIRSMSHTGVNGADLHGIMVGHVDRVLVQDIDIEGLKVSDRIMTVADKSSYLLGNQIYQNYVMTIDWKSDRLYLDPIDEIRPDSLKAFQFTFSPNYESLKIEVVRTQVDHVLEDPVQIGAQVISINDRDVAHFATMQALCDYWDEHVEDIDAATMLDVIVIDEGKERSIRLTEKVVPPIQRR